MTQFKVIWTHKTGVMQVTTVEKNSVKSAWTAAKKIAGKQFNTVILTKEEI